MTEADIMERVGIGRHLRYSRDELDDLAVLPERSPEALSTRERAWGRAEREFISRELGEDVRE